MTGNDQYIRNLTIFEKYYHSRQNTHLLERLSFKKKKLNSERKLGYNDLGNDSFKYERGFEFIF